MISKGFYEYLEAIAEERRLEKSDVLAAPRDPCRRWRGTLASGHKPR